MSKKRLFLALPLLPSFLELFGRYQKSSSLKGIRWIASSNLHITVYFLGDVEEQKIEPLCDKLQRCFSAITPFLLEFEDIVFAPPKRPPRMVWATFAANKDYQNMVFKIAEASDSLYSLQK